MPQYLVICEKKSVSRPEKEELQLNFWTENDSSAVKIGKQTKKNFEELFLSREGKVVLEVRDKRGDGEWSDPFHTS